MSEPLGRFVAAFPLDGSLQRGLEVYEYAGSFRVWQSGQENPIVCVTFGEAIALCLHNNGWGDFTVEPEEMPPPSHTVDVLAFPPYLASCIAQREAEAEWLATLPAFPADGACPLCKERCWKVNSLGYSQFVSARYEAEAMRERNGDIVYDAAGEPRLDDGKLIAYTDGWDDMSEESDFTYVECGGCYRFHCPTPDHLEWK